VQLADTTTGDELWAERYDRPLRDVFALQDEIVRRIVTTLKLQIELSQEGIVIPRSTGNLEAYDDALRGTEYLAGINRTRILKHARCSNEQSRWTLGMRLRTRFWAGATFKAGCFRWIQTQKGLSELWKLSSKPSLWTTP
jgi:hypothetical protein